MKRIILLILITISINSFQIQQTIGLKINKSKLEIDCSQYKNDDEIIDAFPFPIPPNPTNQYPDITYSQMNKNHHIYHLRIVNQKEIPSLIYCFKCLTKLELVNINSKQDFPINIKYLPYTLVELIIDHTNISSIPEEISRLTNLKTLILSNTGLKFLPDAIGNLSSLNLFSLKENNLKTLPKTMNKLRQLKKIILSNNPQLSSIQSLNSLPNLEHLDVKQCSILFLPRNLPQLTELYMSKNKLKSLINIPTLGYGTNNSKMFYFDQNYIQILTPKIQYVPNLYELNLCQNKLYSLPTNILKMKTLSILNIKNNSFSHQDLKTIVTILRQELPNLEIIHD